MSDRFSSISPDGLRIAASALPSGGQAVQYVGPAIGLWQPVPVEFDAMGGVWQTNDRLLFVRNKPGSPQDGTILLWRSDGTSEYYPNGFEGWSCHNGYFAAWVRAARLKSITISREQHRAGTVDLHDGVNVALEVDVEEIDRGPIAEPRYTGEALVWVKWVNGVRRIFGRKHHGAPTEDLSWPFPDDEFWPLAIETPLGLYVLTHGHPEKGRPLWLRPWAVGQTHGYVVAHGLTDRPDARALERGLVLVAFSNLRELQRVTINLAAPLEDVRGPIVVPPTPPPPTVEPPKETPVQLEPKHSALIEEFAARFGLPGFLKEEGQAWVAKLAGTFKARWPHEGWGTKRASTSRPLSNESIARRANGRLWGYDLIIGAGAPGQTLAPHAHAEDITDQVFVDVEARDWLAGTTPTPGPNPTPTPQPPAFTFPTGVEMPEDVALSVIDGYLAGIRERDKVRAQDVVPSRGALMYLFAVFFRELSSWIGEHKRAPQGVEWWAVRDRITAAVVKHYQDRQGVD